MATHSNTQQKGHHLCRTNKSEQSSVAAPASTPEKKAEIANASDTPSGNNVRSATIPLVLLGVEALSVLGGLLFMRRH